tara:strand:+ start:5086 stop:9120 length:4035 start_codon:yes stop_codon:yes gene_type:complete
MAIITKESLLNTPPDQKYGSFLDIERIDGTYESIYSSREYEDSTFFQNVADTFENHFWDEAITEVKALDNKEEGYDFAEQVTELFPDLLHNNEYLENLARSNSLDSLKIRGNNIRDNLRSKQIMSHANFGYHLLHEMMAYAISDPLMLTPIGARKWAHQPLKTTWYKYGATSAAAVTPYELARVKANATVDDKEALLTIPVAGLLMSAVGPALGKMFSGTMTPTVIKELVEDTKWKAPFEVKDYLSLRYRAKELDNNNIIIDDVDGIPVRKYKNTGELVDEEFMEITGRTMPDIPKKPTKEIFTDRTGESKQLPIPEGGSGYQGARAVLSRPFGLEQSSYDMIKDIGLLWSRDKVFIENTKIDDLSYIMNIADEIAGDNSTMMSSNMHSATPQSVDSLYKQNWYHYMYDTRSAIDNNWATMINLPGRVQGSPDITTTFQGLNRKVSSADMSDWRARKTKGFLGKKQSISKAEFQKKVSTQILRPDENAHPSIKEAAKQISKVYEDFGVAIDDAGLSFNEKNITKNIKQLEVRLKALEDVKIVNEYTNKDITKRIRDVKDDIGFLKEELKILKSKPLNPQKTAEKYFPLLWNIGKIRANKKEVIDLLTQEFKREMASGAKKRATETVNRMIREEGHFDGTGMTGSNVSNLMQRKLDIKGDWFLKYIELDTEIVTRNYIRRMGAHIEMSKLGDGDRLLTNKLDGIKEKFGNIRRDIAVSKTLSGAEKKKRIEKLDIQEYEILDHVETLRDRVLGTFVSGEQIHTYSARASRVLKNMGVVLLAGKFTLNSVADLGTMSMHYGMKNQFGTMFERFLSPKANPAMNEIFEAGARDSKVIASAFDTVMHSANARMMEFDGVIPGQNTAIESFFENNANRMFKVNLLNYWTTFSKEVATVLSVDTIIKDSVRLGKLYKEAGNTITDDVAFDWMRLRSQGLTDNDILSIATNTGGVKWKRVDFKSEKVLEDHKGIGWKDTVSKMTEEDYKYVADLDGWTNKGIASRFGTAVHTDVNMSVMTPSIATRPEFLEGMWRGVPHTKQFAKTKKEAQDILNHHSETISAHLSSLRKLGVKFDKFESAEKYYDFLKGLAKELTEDEVKLMKPETLALKEEIIAEAQALQRVFTKVEDLKKTYTNVSRKYSPVMSLFFQFRTFGISAATKIALGGIQKRARYPMQGAVALTGLAYFSQWAKNPQSFGNKDIGEQLLTSLEYSGMSAWLLDFNTTMETLSGNNIGIRPLTNQDPRFDYEGSADAIGSALGTPFVAPINLIKLLTGGTLSGGSMSTRERVMLFYRTLPFNNLFLLDTPFNLPSVRKLIDGSVTKFGGEDVDKGSAYQRMKDDKNIEETLGD